MSFQVALDSRNVLVPLSLEDARGERMHHALSRLATATAMVIQVSASGSFTQEFVPLRIRQDVARGYAGGEWELWVQKAGGDGLCAYYLGIPDRLFATADGAEPPRSLSVEVVGTSPLTGKEDFTGGVDVALQAHVEPPLIPGFLGLSERFFPTLLPHNFLERQAIAEFEFGGRRSLLLMAALQVDPADRLPVSLGKHWDAKNWIQAVVENLAPADPAAAPSWFAIQGGCFYGRNGKLSHWFGGGIGLDGKGFRQAATDRIRSLGPVANGAWVFWLEADGDAAGLYEVLKNPGAAARRRIDIRHPMLRKLLGAESRIPAGPGLATLAEDLPVGEAVRALAAVAGVLAGHQDTLLRARVEPSHAAWSERANPAVAAALALEASATDILPPAPASQERLANDIRALHAAHGETLRALEALFDETYGYSAWDAVGNPLRETLVAYLTEQPARAAAAAGPRSPT